MVVSLIAESTDKKTLMLVGVGAVNWGLVRLAQFDLVTALSGGSDAALARLVYMLVGVPGVALAATTAISGSGAVADDSPHLAPAFICSLSGLQEQSLWLVRCR